MNRRTFNGHLVRGAGVITLAGTTLSLGGCSVVSDIENWTSVGLASLNSIEIVLQANGFQLTGPVLIAFNDAIAALNAIEAAAMEYASTTPPPNGALQKLQAVLKAAADQVGAFLASLMLPGGGILNLVIGLAGVIISTIMGFMNRLPMPTGNTFKLSDTWRVGNKNFPVTAKERTRRAYKSDWNGQLDQGKKAGAMVPSAAYLHVSFLEHL